MKPKINEYCEQLIQQSIKVHKTVSDLEMALLNLKISAAKIPEEESRVLSTIVDYLQRSIHDVGLAGDNTNEVCHKIMNENIND